MPKQICVLRNCFYLYRKNTRICSGKEFQTRDLLLWHYGPAVFYFIPVDIQYEIGFPLTVLSLFSFWLLPWPMSLAMLASAAGDYAGAAGSFIVQMSCFAVAHLFIILFFIGKMWMRFQSFRTEGKLLRRVGYAAAMGTMVIILVIFAMLQ